MTASRFRLLAAVLLAACLLAGCASVSDAASRRALDELSTATTTDVPAPSAEPSTPDRCTQLGINSPTTERPGNNALAQAPTGPTMEAIQRRGKLRVGVDENTLYFSRRGGNGDFTGFEPELAHRIAGALLGDRDAVTFVPVITDTKIDAVKDGTVDMTISVVSKSCSRWNDVDFTSTYYATDQRILVPTGSAIGSAADLDGRRVCVTGSSSSETYAEEHTTAVVVPVDARTDCLVALQEGRVDAVLLPYSILFGLAAQDPTTTILPEKLQPQSYGIPIQRGNEDLVRFVNALLEQWRTDGTLDELQAEWPTELRASAPVPAYREP